MLSVFSESSAVEKIFISDLYPNWQKVIANQTQVYVNLTNDELMTELTNEESPLSMFYHSNMGAKSPVALGDDFRFGEDPKTILNDPYGLFIIDVDKNEANLIGIDYGMEVYSSQELKDLHDFNIEGDFEKDEIVINEISNLSGWSSLLNEFENQKSNGTVIIDRNLFSNEQRGRNLGIVNLKNYFNIILPAVIAESYDILIITQNKGALSRVNSRDLIVENLVEEIKSLRGYEINIELLIIHSSTLIFENTHQRRILKNYHYGNSEHGFALFNVNNQSQVCCDNDFSLHSHYHSIIMNPCSDLSIKRRRKLFKRLNEIKVEAEIKLDNVGQSDMYFRLYYNGEEDLKLKNRLLL